jgi:hypothetical protein
MLSAPHQTRLHQLTLLTGLGAVACYFLVLQPLSRMAAGLDRPLAAEWKRLSEVSAEAATVTGYELTSITNQLQQLREATAQMNALRQVIWASLELEDAIRAKLIEPFQLIDFQNERYRRTEGLRTLARQRGVTLEPPVIAGFPEYTADTREPALLWAQLALADRMVETALHCRVGSIRTIAFPTVRPYLTPGTTNAELLEIPLRLELSGPMPALSLFLLSLPQRSNELRSLGLTNVPPGKPALLIDRLLLRRLPTDKPDEVLLELRAAGFLNRPQSATGRPL